MGSGDTRTLIEETVEENDGISFTELKDETGLCNGVLQYHIRRSDKIHKKKSAILPVGRCEECRFNEICQDRCVHGVLRKDMKREIIERLEDGEKQKDIAEALGLDKSTVSYHIRYLKNSGVLDEQKQVRQPVKAAAEL
ncbi:MAG: winged helix-turn-helix transcriptional regulator [Candidatus Nanohaloarchaea archaeon]